MGKLPRLLAADINTGKDVTEPVNDLLPAEKQHIEGLILMLGLFKRLAFGILKLNAITSNKLLMDAPEFTFTVLAVCLASKAGCNLDELLSSSARWPQLLFFHYLHLHRLNK